MPDAIAIEKWRAKGYEPLGRSSIRLLSIRPGFPTEPIECAFLTILDLEDAPEFDALSYVWGTQLSATPIICNGIEVPVTQNLADALVHLRKLPGWDANVQWPRDHPLHSTKNAWGGFAKNRNEYSGRETHAEELLVWVDALCINQEDFAERASQVAIMGRIYSQAYKVMIWLGKENKQSLQHQEVRAKTAVPQTKAPVESQSRFYFYLGMYGMMPICLSFIAQALRHMENGENKLAAMNPTEDSKHRNMAYGFPAPDAKEWDYLRDFFTNPWFERVWVAQEAVLANRATVLVGNWEIEWAAIGQAAVWFEAKGYGMPAVVRYQMPELKDYLPISKAASIWDLCSWPKHEIPLLKLIREFRTRQATNPVDKIYATFGLAAEMNNVSEKGFHELVRPDYTKALVDVYRDMAKFLIIEHGNLEVLSHAGGSTLKVDWPSWVPDWRHEKVTNEMVSSRHPNVYNADDNQPLSIGVSANPDALVLQGIEVDSVIAYGDRLMSYGFGYVTYQEEIDFIKAAWALFEHCSSIPSDPYKDQAIEEVFVNTLTAGLNNRHMPVSEDICFLPDAAHWFSKHSPNLLSTKLQINRRPKWSTVNSADSGRYHEAFVHACVDRRFFVSRSGLMGIGPETMREGDIVAVLFGGKVPYLLRPQGGRYRYIGECYVHRMMEGEAIEKWIQKGRKQDLFELF
ncbi:hypothetical protein BU24DRAFT_422083 [Aaosphaeria arxii CBS 175.79]|uniref:Heterokaryon incompatibility domain-containing protein n=1 Tax=Aaosphaeria arxii CBS 175.79 TaxID=1450172 RepID=A0A6A5XS91_9PLEO|nr:uncharacterized protein BU24DRAFT_422083 [Aaosphaeria arxii CBS 175.79]KAF2015766.1 hypothetical protein BU24DRAFT_422083 [Aaosphaeria arxii CBS 175.79]